MMWRGVSGGFVHVLCVLRPHNRPGSDLFRHNLTKQVCVPQTLWNTPGCFTSQAPADAVHSGSGTLPAAQTRFCVGAPAALLGDAAAGDGEGSS